MKRVTGVTLAEEVLNAHPRALTFANIYDIIGAKISKEVLQASLYKLMRGKKVERARRKCKCCSGSVLVYRIKAEV